MQIDPELPEMLKKCRAERRRLREIGGVAPVTMNTLSAVILCLEALCEKIPAITQPCGVPSPEAKAGRQVESSKNSARTSTWR